MKFFIILSTLMAFTCAVSDAEWNAWKQKFGKSYQLASWEKQARESYDENDAIIKAHNAKFDAGEVSFQMAHNQLSDAYDKIYNSIIQDTIYAPVTPNIAYIKCQAPPAGWVAPDSLDLSKDDVLPIRDMGTCGAGFAFAGVSMLEEWGLKHFTDTLPTKTLSVQEIIECVKPVSARCQGGWIDEVLTYDGKNGLTWEGKYGSGVFEGYNGKTCSAATYKQFPAIGLPFPPKDLCTVSPDDNSLAYALQYYGWVSVCLDARKWQFYSNGVMKAVDCGPIGFQKPNFCLNIVGYGERDGQKYWLARNSWSKNWGQNGYIYLERGNNVDTCGLFTGIRVAVY